MKTKGIITVVILVIAIGAGAYWLGKRKAVTTPPPKKQDSRAYPSSNQPIDYNEILSELRIRLAERPDDWELNSRMADALFNIRRFDEAIVYYKKAILLNPGDVDSYNDLGLANYYTGDTAGGLKFVEEGIKKSPDYQRIWLTKGFLLAYGLGNREEATVAWEKAISIDPESSVGKAAYAYLDEFKKR